MNTKKSKFQQVVDRAVKKYLPEEDGGAMNDKLKLHRMGTDMDQDQTQDPNYVKVFSIKDIEVLTQAIEEKIIPANEMPQQDFDAHLGYNTAIRECITLLNKVTRETKVKLHKGT
jgi:hypothetical protein